MNITINKQENILNNIVLNELVDMRRLNTLLNIKHIDLLHNEKKPENDARKMLISYKKKIKKNIVKTKYNRKIKVIQIKCCLMVLCGGKYDIFYVVKIILI